MVGVRESGGDGTSQSVEDSTLCDVRGVTIRYRGAEQTPAVDDVNLTIRTREKVCLVGESGSGKTTLGLAIAGLLPASAVIESGSLRILDLDMASANRRAIRRLCARYVGWVPQDPLTSLNPVFRIQYQLSEALSGKRQLTREERRERMEKALRAVRLRDPKRVLESYPHELSGGMRQRVLIAAAILKEPRLLIADEPTTALDATVQVQILSLLKEVVEEHGLTLLMVTHDLAVAAAVADTVYVMLQGRVVESGEASNVLARPQAEYTRRLIEASEWKGLDSVPR